MSKVLLILGMHRSGTSLLAQHVKNLGINLGDRLLGKGIANQDGHFEDLDFLDFHRNILKENNCHDYLVDSKEKIKLSKYLEERGRSIVDFKSKLRSQWGWKEPRTCLFIDFWKTVVDDSVFLVSFRHPDLVIDSIIRRERKKVDSLSKRSIARKIWALRERRNLNRAKIDKANEIAKSWLIYNQEIIKNIDSRPTYLINVDNIEEQADSIYNFLTEQGFEVTNYDFSTVYKPKNIKSQPTTPTLISDNTLYKECMEVYEHLQNLVSD